MAKINFILICLLSLLYLVNICSAEVDFSIPEGTKIANAGETISYDLDISITSADPTVTYPITEEFSVDPIIEDWGYSFSKNKVILDPTNSPEASSILYIKVPNNAPQGEYSHTVYATGTDSSGDPYINPVEVTFYVINTNVSVPEFPSVVVPVVAVLGLVMIFGRRKE